MSFGYRQEQTSCSGDGRRIDPGGEIVNETANHCSRLKSLLAAQVQERRLTIKEEVECLTRFSSIVPGSR